MTVHSEKRAAFKNCMCTENNLNEEQFRFIMEFIELDQDSLKMFKDNAAVLQSADDIIRAMLKIDADNGMRMFFHRLLPSAASSVISLIPMTLAAVGLAGLLEGVDAGLNCLPTLFD